MKFIAIVEGYGDVAAVRVLLRRVLQEQLQCYDVGIERPIRVPKGKLLKPGELERAVNLAARRISATDGIVVLVDADDDCPAELAPAMATRAAESHLTERSRPVKGHSVQGSQARPATKRGHGASGQRLVDRGNRAATGS